MALKPSNDTVRSSTARTKSVLLMRVLPECRAAGWSRSVAAAHGFVDASGDAALTWQAGLPCWVPERPIYGSQQVIVENVDESHQPGWGEIDALLAARGGEHGLLRRGGLAFFFPDRGTAVLNVTHIEAPLDPVRSLAGPVRRA